jgi:hypothetical protein
LEFINVNNAAKGSEQHSRDDLMQLEVQISLHDPTLQEDVAHVRKVYDEFLERLKHAQDVGDLTRLEFVKNFEKEVAPLMVSVRALLAKVSRKHSASAP